VSEAIARRATTTRSVLTDRRASAVRAEALFERAFAPGELRVLLDRDASPF
jgi:hypothetical protein